MPKTFNINELDRITIVGVGLLGGSVGLACRAAGFGGTLVGVGRRTASLRKARASDAVDTVTRDPAAGVEGAGLVVLAAPIRQFESLLTSLGPALGRGAHVTDVASTKEHVVGLCERLLPRTAKYVGSHPMAGSEKTGVEFARADLFDRSLCLVTPTPKTAVATTRWVRQFWKALGSRTQVLPPRRHDELMARVSHLPHAVAAALVRLALDDGAIDVAGPGFADTTRIASGDAALWTDILRTNRKPMVRAIDRLIGELRTVRSHLTRDDEAELTEWLDAGRKARDRWLARRYRKQELPP